MISKKAQSEILKLAFIVLFFSVVVYINEVYAYTSGTYQDSVQTGLGDVQYIIGYNQYYWSMPDVFIETGSYVSNVALYFENITIPTGYDVKKINLYLLFPPYLSTTASGSYKVAVLYGDDAAEPIKTWIEDFDINEHTWVSVPQQEFCSRGAEYVQDTVTVYDRSINYLAIPSGYTGDITIVISGEGIPTEMTGFKTWDYNASLAPRIMIQYGGDNPLEDTDNEEFIDEINGYYIYQYVDGQKPDYSLQSGMPVTFYSGTTFSMATNPMSQWTLTDDNDYVYVFAHSTATDVMNYYVSTGSPAWVVDTKTNFMTSQPDENTVGISYNGTELCIGSGLYVTGSYYEYGMARAVDYTTLTSHLSDQAGSHGGNLMKGSASTFMADGKLVIFYASGTIVNAFYYEADLGTTEVDLTDGSWALVATDNSEVIMERIGDSSDTVFLGIGGVTNKIEWKTLNITADTASWGSGHYLNGWLPQRTTLIPSKTERVLYAVAYNHTSDYVEFGEFYENGTYTITPLFSYPTVDGVRIGATRNEDADSDYIIGYVTDIDDSDIMAFAYNGVTWNTTLAQIWGYTSDTVQDITPLHFGNNVTGGLAVETTTAIQWLPVPGAFVTGQYVELYRVYDENGTIVYNATTVDDATDWVYRGGETAGEDLYLSTHFMDYLGLTSLVSIFILIPLMVGSLRSFELEAFFIRFVLFVLCVALLTGWLSG